jgi:hypothetical protein
MKMSTKQFYPVEGVKPIVVNPRSGGVAVLDDGSPREQEDCGVLQRILRTKARMPCISFALGDSKKGPFVVDGRDEAPVPKLKGPTCVTRTREPPAATVVRLNSRLFSVPQKVDTVTFSKDSEPRNRRSISQISRADFVKHLLALLRYRFNFRTTSL